MPPRPRKFFPPGRGTGLPGLGRATQAELSLHRAINADPSNPEPWRLLLEILRVEDRTLEAQHLGWVAYDQVRPEARRELLRELTLGSWPTCLTS